MDSRLENKSDKVVAVVDILCPNITDACFLIGDLIRCDLDGDEYAVRQVFITQDDESGWRLTIVYEED